MFDDLSDEQLETLKTVFVCFEQGDPVYDLDNHYGYFNELKNGLHECIKTRYMAKNEKMKKDIQNENHNG